MSSAKSIRVLIFTIVVGVLTSTIGVVGTASALIPRDEFNPNVVVSGGGNAGPGSLAVAAIFSLRDSSGAGAFSGVVGGVVALGLFSLTVINPANAPVLPCPLGEVSAGGTMVSGNDWVIPYVGDNVLVAGCVGSGVPGAFIIYHSVVSNPDFSGQGTGTGTLSRLLEHEGMFVAAGVTSGSGSAGSGTVYTAEAETVANDGTVTVGGAFLGSFLAQTGNTWVGNKASVQPGCTLTTSGTTASWGSFPNQPVSSAYTLVTCPPASLGTQTARFLYAIGGDASPIYKGTGSALVELFAFLAE